MTKSCIKYRIATFYWQSRGGKFLAKIPANQVYVILVSDKNAGLSVP